MSSNTPMEIIGVVKIPNVNKFTVDKLRIIYPEFVDGKPVATLLSRMDYTDYPTFQKMESFIRGDLKIDNFNEKKFEEFKSAIRRITIILTSMHFQSEKRVFLVTFYNKYVNHIVSFYTTYDSIIMLKNLFGEEVFELKDLAKYLESKKKEFEEIVYLSSLFNSDFPTSILKYYLERDDFNGRKNTWYEKTSFNSRSGSCILV